MHDVAKPLTQTEMKSRRGTMWKAIAGLVVLLVGIKAMQIAKMMSTPMVMPATTVTSAPVKEEDWAPILSAVGSVSAVQGATLSTDLAARKVISKAELDAAESKFKQKEGTVDNMRAMVGKKEVRAPFDGQLGIRQVNVGQMINSGQQVVALTALDPVYVDFALPQQELAKLSPGFEVRVHTDAVPGREFKGKLTAINSMVDTVTRNVTLQATLENPDHALRPGMFGKVEVMLPEKHKALVVPGSAISYAPFGDSVFVIEKKKDPKSGKESQTIRQQFVRVGEARGDFVSINDGLKPNETIVSTGVFKLRNGMTVTINNDLAPKPQLNPTPVDS